MRRFIPWVNFLVFGALALLALGAATWVQFTDQALGAYVTAWCTAAAFLAVFLVVFLGWLLRRPDFIVCGVAVWTGNIRAINQHTMRAALEYYCETLPKLLHAKFLDERHVATVSNLTCMLPGARIQWTKGAVSRIGIGWLVKDKAGLQRGKDIALQWMSTIASSALFHELHHMVDEVIFKKIPDHRHANRAWWDLVPELRRGFQVELMRREGLL